jgi:hypothetical protein
LVQREHPAKPAAAADEHCRQLTSLVKVGRVDGHLRGDVDHGVPELAGRGLETDYAGH